MRVDVCLHLDGNLESGPPQGRHAQQGTPDPGLSERVHRLESALDRITVDLLLVRELAVEVGRHVGVSAQDLRRRADGHARGPASKREKPLRPLHERVARIENAAGLASEERRPSVLGGP